MIELLEISGIHLPTNNADDILCQIYLEDEIHTSFSSQIIAQYDDNPKSPMRVLFPTGNKCKLVDTLAMDDKRICTFQLSYKNSVNDEIKEVVSVNISIDDLVIAEGSKFETMFVSSVHNDDDLQLTGKIVIIPWVVKKIDQNRVSNTRVQIIHG